MTNKILHILFLGTLLFIANTSYAQSTSDWTTISNGALWTDDRGQVVQAHGAGFLKVDDTWYMIGEDRSNTWRPDVNMYSSKDLINWKFERKIIKNGVTHSSLGDDRFIERPKLMYCKKTGKYVVWCHWESGNYGASEAAVFYCDSVNGDYKYHWSGRPLGVKSRDCNVFVDNDGTAYFISTIEENQHLGLFKLSDDYLSAESYTELFKWQGREAPAIIRVDDTYFMMFSACSGWDPNQATYSYSKSLTSGWSDRKNIGNSIASDTQAASILTIQGTEGTSYIYVGDRWQDPDLFSSKTIMFPITFSGTSINFNYTPIFDLNQKTGKTRTTDRSRYLSKSGWKVIDYSSQETSSENGAASNIIDGNTNTKWHTQYSGTQGSAPHHVTVDMGEEKQMGGFLCAPRSDHSTNGLIRKYVFQVSTDNENWTTVSAGTWLPYYAEIGFNPITARYFRLTALEGDYASLVEIDILGDTPENFKEIKINPSWKIPVTTTYFYSTDIKLRKGGNVTLRVNAAVDNGEWTVHGPGLDMESGVKEYTISDLDESKEGTYTFIFNDHFCRSNRQSFNVSIRTVTPNDITEVDEDLCPTNTSYYDLTGRQVTNPQAGNVYIVRETYADGKVRTLKRITIN